VLFFCTSGEMLMWGRLAWRETPRHAKHFGLQKKAEATGTDEAGRGFCLTSEMAKRDTSGTAFRSLAGWAGKRIRGSCNNSMCAFRPTQTRIPARFRTNASSDDNAYQSVKLQDAILCPTLDGAAGAVVNQRQRYRRFISAVKQTLTGTMFALGCICL